MKISTDNGSITFASGAITRDIVGSSFLKTPIGIGAETIKEVDPSTTYRIFPESGVIASVRFRTGVLEMVSILFEMAGDSEDNWTRDRELVRKAVHDQWLLKELGLPPYRFSWGDIESLFDEKACVSEIVVGYGARRVQQAWWQKGGHT